MQQARYRAKDRLELVHGDLCGPITPATPSGKKYFLLLVDDAMRYMWLALLTMKDEAAAAIIRLQAGVESESGCVTLLSVTIVLRLNPVLLRKCRHKQMLKNETNLIKT